MCIGAGNQMMLRLLQPALRFFQLAWTEGEKLLPLRVVQPVLLQPRVVNVAGGQKRHDELTGALTA